MCPVCPLPMAMLTSAADDIHREADWGGQVGEQLSRGKHLFRLTAAATESVSTIAPDKGISGGPRALLPEGIFGAEE